LICPVEFKPVTNLSANDIGKLVRIISQGENFGRIVSLTEYLNGSPMINETKVYINLTIGVKMSIDLDELVWA